MPCSTVVLHREQQLWLFLQALLLCNSSWNNKGAALGIEAALASLDGSFFSWLCEGLNEAQGDRKQNEKHQHESQQKQEQQLKQEYQQDGRQQQQQLQQEQNQVTDIEERLLQAVAQCPFSKRCVTQKWLVGCRVAGLFWSAPVSRCVFSFIGMHLCGLSA